MHESPHTLNEFMLQTKSVLYLLGLGYLVAFVGFWRFLHGRQKTED